MNNKQFLVVTEYEKKLPFHLLGVSCQYDQEPKQRPQGVPFFNWIQCYDGEGELELQDKVYPVVKGQGILIFPDTPLQYYPVTHPWMVDWISFNGEQVENMIKLAGAGQCGVYDVKSPGSLHNIMSKLLTLAQSDKEFKSLDCSLLVYEFITILHKNIISAAHSTRNLYYNKLQPVLDYISDNYSKIIVMEELAQIIGVTPEYLCHLFKKACRKRPMEYITEFRLGISKDLLINQPKMEIHEIAFKVGYENVSYFCSVFKKYEGMSPGYYRQLYTSVY